MPSRRGAAEQPNAGSQEALLSPRFWAALVVVGVLTGLTGLALMSLLLHVEHWVFDYRVGDFGVGVRGAPGQRRVVALLAAGAFGGVAWYLLRRLTPGRNTDLDDVVWTARGRLSLRRSAGTSVISEIVIAMGASLGREAAPKLMGGVWGDHVGRRAGLSGAQVRLLIACGGGAGLACVYNVPFGGAFFTAEVLCGTVSVATMLPALACSGLATVTAWLYLPNSATYPGVLDFQVTASVVVWALLAGPVIGLLTTGYIRLIGWLSHHRIGGWRAIVAPVVAFGMLGLIGLHYPQLLGNGKPMAHDAFLSHGTIGVLLALAVLKPLVTALCLGSGASGGLFTPVLSTGAVLGAGTGIAWSQLWGGTPSGAFAVIGAAAMIGCAMQAPVSGVALVLELTHTGFGLMVPMVAATVLATLVVRTIDGYSIYSARLPAHDAPPGSPPTSGLTA